MSKFNPIITKCTNNKSMMHVSSYDESLKAINSMASPAKIIELIGTKQDKYEDRLKFHNVFLNTESNIYDVQIKDTQENKERAYIEYVLRHGQSAKGWSVWEHQEYRSDLTDFYKTIEIIYNELLRPFGTYGWYPCDVKCLGLNDDKAYMFIVAYANKKSKNTYNIDQFNISLYANRLYSYNEDYGIISYYEPNLLEYNLKKLVNNKIISNYTTLPKHWSAWGSTSININIVSMRNRYLKYVEKVNKNENIKMEKWIVADIGKGQQVLNTIYDRLYKYNLRVLANHVDIDDFIDIPRYSQGMVKINVDDDGNPFTTNVNKPTVTLYMKENNKEGVNNILCEYIDILRGFSIMTFMKSKEYAHRVKSYFGELKCNNYRAELIKADTENNNNPKLTFEITYVE